MNGLITLLIACAGGRGAPAVVPDTLAALSLTINIPAYRLDVLEFGQVVRSYPVAVGQRAYRTPLGRVLIGRLEMNPWWIPPPGSDWAADKDVTPPGPTNPMGRAKLSLWPLYFLHGTPDTASPGRAASHGCVRMANRDVLEVARRVLLAGAPVGPLPAWESLSLDSTTTRTFELGRPVPMEVRYDLVEIVGNRLLVHRDIYRLRSPALEAAVTARIDSAVGPGPVPEGVVRRLLDAARRRSVELRLDSVFPGLPP